MNDRGRLFAAVFVTVCLFLGVQFGALALVEPFHDANHQVVEDPDDPTVSILYLVAIVVMTGFMLAAFRYGGEWVIRGLVVGVSVLLSWFVFAEVIPPAVTVDSVNVLAVVGALAVGAGLLVHPEWYVIDAAGVVMGAGAAGLFGISFGLLPALVLLCALAVYDAISVYKTKHMLSLAEGVMDLKIPVVLVVPTTISYSYLATGATEGVLEDESAQTEGENSSDEPTADASTNGGSEAATELATDADAATDAPAPNRDALFIGLGDAVIPTILVASAAYFIEAGTIAVPGISLNLAALGAIFGTIAGLVVLMTMVIRGRPHAGLPLLNGGAIGGYLVGALASGLTVTAALGF